MHSETSASPFAVAVSWGIRGLPSDQAVFLCSPSRHPQRTSWVKSAEKSRRRPSRWSGSSCTAAGWCPSSVPSPTPRSGGRSEYHHRHPCPGPPHIPPRDSGLVTGWGWGWGRSRGPRQQQSSLEHIRAQRWAAERKCVGSGFPSERHFFLDIPRCACMTGVNVAPVAPGMDSARCTAHIRGLGHCRPRICACCAGMGSADGHSLAPLVRKHPECTPVERGHKAQPPLLASLPDLLC